ncbi:SH3 domain-containing protein [Streptomyces spectabilis]|uniref:SH3 domain-containing protein n=1 Tax=Streptomyces spectabilis TaxID=68270 RepID=A0A516RDC7_STRST|nr:SH3 domain-containing protein [Streptomyces spectabilis]QDQ13661.1 SH3 domain-containing protein [Streptomyces spectabilis]
MALRPRSLAVRIGIAAAGGALAVTTLATAPALAADSNEHPRVYKGRITAKGGLLLRDRPTRGSHVIRHEPYGKIVHIFCKTRGDSVQGNDRWYLLTDGTWAWGAAHYIANVGPAPRWC